MTERAVLVVDPPWQLTDALPGPGRGASKHYPCMPYHELMTFQLPPIAPDAVLFLWRLASMPEEALWLCRDWGFVPKAELVWRKTTKHGKRHFGMGRSVRAEHETCIIAHRGKPKRLSASVRSVFDAPIGVHSAKPDAFYDIVEQLYAGPYADVFARRKRDGWLCVGNEL